MVISQVPAKLAFWGAAWGAAWTAATASSKAEKQISANPSRDFSMSNSPSLLNLVVDSLGWAQAASSARGRKSIGLNVITGEREYWFQNLEASPGRAEDASEGSDRSVGEEVGVVSQLLETVLPSKIRSSTLLAAKAALDDEEPTVFVKGEQVGIAPPVKI